MENKKRLLVPAVGAVSLAAIFVILAKGDFNKGLVTHGQGWLLIGAMSIAMCVLWCEVYFRVFTTKNRPAKATVPTE